MNLKTFIYDTTLKNFFGVLFDAASACTVFLSHFMLSEIVNNGAYDKSLNELVFDILVAFSYIPV